MPRRRIAIASTLIAVFVAGSAQSGDLLDRLDRVECMSAGLLATSVMRLRLNDESFEAALAQADSPGHADLVRQAFAEPRRSDPAVQARTFAEHAMRACRDRLYLERQQALLERVRSRNAERKPVFAW